MFADEDIPKGTVTWRFNPRFDVVFMEDEVKTFPELQQKLIQHFAYFSNRTNRYIYSIDYNAIDDRDAGSDQDYLKK